MNVVAHEIAFYESYCRPYHPIELIDGELRTTQLKDAQCGPILAPIDLIEQHIPLGIAGGPTEQMRG